jgi:hypothetical protein
MLPFVKEDAMKYIVTAAALALFGMGPVLASGPGCDYGASSASAQPASQLAAAPAPAASKAPSSAASNSAVAKKNAKQVADKSKEPAADAKVAVASAK